MSVLIFLVVYFTIGVTLVESALRISQYNLEKDGFERYRSVAFIAALWPIFLMLMIAYWCWAGYHGTKQWIRTL